MKHAIVLALLLAPLAALHAAEEAKPKPNIIFVLFDDMGYGQPKCFREGTEFKTPNHTKADYNIGGRDDKDCWDSAAVDAWNKRKPGQPFFQVLNFDESHEGEAQGDVTKTRHSPADVTLAKYHPDELPIRMSYAKYYDAVENLDTEIKEKSAEKVG